jgi:HK97 family phage major capsid protein
MDEILKRLREQRARAWEAYKAFLDSITAEVRDMSGEEKAKDENFRTDLDGLDIRIDDLDKRVRADQARETNRAKIEAITGRNVTEDEGRADQKDAELIRSVLTGKSRSALIPISGMHVDRGADGRYQVRTLTSGTLGSGGALIPSSFRQSLYEFLVDESAIRQAGATVITTGGGENLTLPRLVSHGTAAIVGEGTAAAGSDPSFGTIVLGSWKYAQLLQLPRELIEDEQVDLLSFVARDMGRALGAVSGAAFVTGSGTNAPMGIMTASTIGVTGGTGVVGVPTANNLIDLMYSVASPYANRGAWLMARATEGAIRKIKDTYDQYVWQPGILSGTPNQLLGRPVYSDPNVAAMGTNNLAVLFGDIGGYWIRDVGSIEIARSDDFAFSTDLVTYRAILRTDGDLVDTAAVRTFKGGTA